jgi:hypothetical protein
LLKFTGLSGECSILGLGLFGDFVIWGEVGWRLEAVLELVTAGRDVGRSALIGFSVDEEFGSGRGKRR